MTRFAKFAVVAGFALALAGCGRRAGTVSTGAATASGSGSVVAGAVSAPAGSVSAPPAVAASLAARRAAGLETDPVYPPGIACLKKAMKAPTTLKGKKGHGASPLMASSLGLPAVGAGVTVRLIEVDAEGNELRELATTTTDSDGFYAFNIPDGLTYGGSLMVEALNADGTVALRAFASGYITNVNPVSDSVVGTVEDEAGESESDAVDFSSFATGELGSMEREVQDASGDLSLEGSLDDVKDEVGDQSDKDFFVQAGVTNFKDSNEPGITALSAFQGNAGDALIITGRFFGGSQGTSVVSMGGVDLAAADVTSWTDAEINVIIPAAAKSGALVVRKGAQRSNPVRFEVTGDPMPPLLARIAPRLGAAGQTMRLDGEGFGEEALTVTFGGGATATATPCACGTYVDVTIPAGVTTGPVFITRADGLSTNKRNFTVNVMFEQVRARVTVRFVDEDTGAVIPGVEVMAINTTLFTEKDDRGDRLSQEGAFAPKAASGADGRASLDLIPGQYIFRAQPNPDVSGYYPAGMVFFNITGDHDFGDAPFRLGQLVQGRLLDAAGLGIPGVRFDAVEMQPRGSEMGAATADVEDGLGFASGLTGPDGAFKVVLNSGQYNFRFLLPSNGRYPQQGFDYTVDTDDANGTNNADVQFVPEAGVILSGRVTLLGSGGTVPVPGAEVFLITENRGDFASVITGENGGYQVAVFPGNQFVMVFPDPESPFAPLNTSASVMADTTLNLELEAGALLTGVVVDGAGVPLPDLGVGVFESTGGLEGGDDMGMIRTLTDENGRFQMYVGAGDRWYFLGFSDMFLGTARIPDQLMIGYAGQSADGAFPVNGNIDFGTLTVNAGHVVSGQVTNASGEIIDVCANQMGGYIPSKGFAQTDGSGYYSMRLPDGVYEFSFFPRPGASVTSGVLPSVTVAGADLTGVDITLEAGVEIFGTVQDGSGNPLAVQVMANGSGQYSYGFGFTNPSTGEFRFSVPAGMYDIYFYPEPGTAYTNASLWDQSVTAPGPVDLGITTLSAGSFVSGVVLKSPGDVPVSNVVVNIFEDYAEGFGPWVASTFTQADGSFQVALADGTFKMIPFIPPEYGNPDNLVAMIPPTILTVSGAPENVTLYMQAGNRISGRVTDSNGIPISFVSVNVWEDTDPSAGSVMQGEFAGYRETDANGMYEVVATSGNYTVNFYPPFETGYSPSFDNEVTVSGGDVVLNKTLTQGNVVQGVVTGVGGVPVPGVTVEAYEVSWGTGDSILEFGPFVQSVGTGADGSYQMALLDGEYVLHAFIAQGMPNPNRLCMQTSGPNTIPVVYVFMGGATQNIALVQGRLDGLKTYDSDKVTPLGYVTIKGFDNDSPAPPTRGMEAWTDYTDAAGMLSGCVSSGSYVLDFMYGSMNSLGNTVRVPAWNVPRYFPLKFSLDSDSTKWQLDGTVTTQVGAPIPDVDITVWQLVFPGSDPTTTVGTYCGVISSNVEGVFRIQLPPADGEGSYILLPEMSREVSNPSLYAYDVAVDGLITESGPASGISIVMTGGVTKVFGTVTKTGVPVVNGYILVYNDFSSTRENIYRVVRLNPSGVYETRLLGGGYLFDVYDSNWTSLKVKHSVTKAGIDLNVDIVIP
ncbi:MAG: hypothetical protein V1809_00495 [Planctomycetota bacterium]